MPQRTCDCGECKKCKHREYMNAYYRRPGNAEKIRARVREYVKTHGDPRTGFRSYDKQKTQARRKLSWAIQSGQLNRKPCEECGNPKAHGHHDDYSKPLEVRWLCSQCHGKEHRIVA